MIDLRARKGLIQVKPGDELGLNVLKQPLHRVFMRGKLGGQRGEGGAWTFPEHFDEIIVLQALLRHLERYGIEYRLDDGCKEILEQLKAARETYRDRLRRGAAVKASKDGGVTDSIRSSLENHLVRPLTDLQLRAVWHLCEVWNGANFSVPGSGKTSIVLAYMAILRKRRVVRSLLVIGPTSSFLPWEEEFQKCFGRRARAVRLSGRNREERKHLYSDANRYELLLVSYHTAANDLSLLKRLLDRGKYLLVLDESHYIKRPVGGKLAEAALSLAAHAERRVILSGTPMPNGLSDLWSQFTFLWPDRLPLGSASSYLGRVRETSEAQLRAVRDDVSPLFFRITKEQLKLPRPEFKVIRCQLKPVQRRIYRGVGARFLSQVPEAPKDRVALREWRRARVIRLLQIASNPVLLRQGSRSFRLPPLRVGDESLDTLVSHYGEFEVATKIEQACALAQEICSAGRKLIIWSMFVHNLEMLSSHLGALGSVTLHGGVPYGVSDEEEETRERLIQRFKEDEECRVMIANPAACAESISLHSVCHDAVYVDRSFNAAHYLQSLDRIHRLGLDHGDRIRYYLLVADDTIDEVVELRLKEKSRSLRDFVEGDFPGPLPGYWNDELGEEEERDFSLVDQHLRRLGERK